MNLKISSKDVEKIINKLKKFYEIETVENWKDNILNVINELFEEYHVKEFSVNQNSYMGIVIDCKMLDNQSIYIKAVPPMINRFEREVDTLELLPKSLTCKFYKIDYENKIIVMEKINPGTLIEFYHNEEAIKKLFNILNNSKIGLTDDIKAKHLDFYQVVLNDYNLCKKSGYGSDIVDLLFSNFSYKYQKVFDKKEKYLLHGDIYKNNLLDGNDRLVIIDPLGFIAPFEFELVSICSYEMFYNDKNNKEILNDFIDFFKDYTSKEMYLDALYCQLVKLYIPSLYEANDGGIRAQKWLDIIEELYGIE